MQRQDAERTTLYAQQQYAYQFPFLIAAVSTRSLRVTPRWHEMHRKDEIDITQFGLFIITLSIFTYSHLPTLHITDSKHLCLRQCIKLIQSSLCYARQVDSIIGKPWTKFAPSLSWSLQLVCLPDCIRERRHRLRISNFFEGWEIV